MAISCFSVQPSTAGQRSLSVHFVVCPTPGLPTLTEETETVPRDSAPGQGCLCSSRRLREVRTNACYVAVCLGASACVPAAALSDATGPQA